ncbi:hypothetical protein BHM03_00055129 [Ensete ventricosum]|nr:hypothetical protein BHM03_00055129 [Ensete ventricosum]
MQRATATCGLAASGCPLRWRRGSRPLRPGRWRLPLVGWPQPFVLAGLLPLRVAAPCRGLGRSRPPLCRGGLGYSRPPPCRWPAAPTRGLAVAMPGYPLQGLPSLRKCSKNA